MSQKVRQEIIEEVESEILYGFKTEQHLNKFIEEVFRGDDGLDETWVADIIGKVFKEHQAESLSWEKPTDVDRLIKSFDELNQKRIISLHFVGYSKEDGVDDFSKIQERLDSVDITTKGYCFYIGSDIDNALGKDKTLLIEFGSSDEEIYDRAEIGKEIVTTLRKNGLKANWDGSSDTTIAILDMNWRKAPDNIDYNESRVFEMIKNGLTSELASENS